MQVYVANLGKYNEGELVGAWFTPPIDYDEMAERIGLNDEYEKMGYKIREAQLQKIPYMLVVGGKEEENEAVSVRSRFKGDEGQMKLDDFLDAIKEEIANRENRKVEKED